jgi:hypothetical protein
LMIMNAGYFDNTGPPEIKVSATGSG